MIRLGITLLLLLLVACDNTSPTAPEEQNSPVKLIPLSPYELSFRCDHGLGNCRTSYFFAPRQHWKNPAFRKKLLKEVLQKPAKDIQKLSFYSLYVYEKTKELNTNFKGNADALSGTYRSNLMSYSHWKEGKMDMFYLIKDGNIVYDILEDRVIKATWEFDY